MVEQHKLHLDEDFSGKTYAFTLRDTKVEVFKKSIEEGNIKQMWKCFTNLKRKLVNH